MSVQKEERDLYDLALEFGLVEKVSDRGKEEDLDPVTLTYPAAYRTPADFRVIINENQEALSLLQEHVERKRQRQVSLDRLSEDSHLHYADMGGLDDKIKITSGDGKLRVEIDSLSALVIGTVKRFKIASDLAIANHSAFASTSSRILSIADASTADLSSFYAFIPSEKAWTSSLSDSAVEELPNLTATLEARRLRIEADASQPSYDTVPEAMSSLSLDELEALSEEEEVKATAAEEEYKLRIANNIRQGIEEAKLSEQEIFLKRKHALLLGFKALLEAELALLIVSHNSLSTNHDNLNQLRALSVAFAKILEEISTHETNSNTVAELVDEEKFSNQFEKLARSLESITEKPLLNMKDICDVMENSEQMYTERIGQFEAIKEANDLSSQQLDSHLNLYSPTCIPFSTSRSITDLLSTAKIKETRIKTIISSQAARGVELSKQDQKGIERFTSVVGEL